MNSNIHIASDEFKECACACKGCINTGTTILEVKYIQKSGHFCRSCAKELLESGLIVNKKKSKLQSDQFSRKSLPCKIKNNCSNSLSSSFSGQTEKKLRLTPYRRSWVQDKVSKCAKQIGISENDTPDIVCTRKGVLALPKELTTGRRTVTHKCLGICFRRAKTIFINIKYHSSLQDIEHTVVHEFIHYRFPYLRHGKQFEQRIKLILKGKKYPVKDLYPTTTQPIPEHDMQLLLELRHSQLGESLKYEIAEMSGRSVDEVDSLLKIKDPYY